MGGKHKLTEGYHRAPEAGETHHLLLDMDYGLACVTEGCGGVVKTLTHDGERWVPRCPPCIDTALVPLVDHIP